jgi:hypothetical protein
VELLNVETGTVTRKAELLISKDLIPPTISLLPDNYNDALFVLKELSEVANAYNTDFVVKVWTDRGEGGTYREGEELSIHF